MKQISFFILFLTLIVASCSSYEKCGPFVNGIAVAKDKNDHYSYIGSDGKLINKKAVFQLAKDFSDGYGVVQISDHHFALVNKDIQVVTTEKYHYLKPFINGYALFTHDGEHYGIMDTALKTVLPPLYQFGSTSEGLTIVSSDGLYGFVDSTYTIVVPCQYQRVRDFENGKAIVYKDDVAGLIDRSNHYTRLGKFEYLSNYADGFVKARKSSNGPFALIDSKGRKTSDYRYLEMRSFQDGFAPVLHKRISDGKECWGMINTKGDEVVQCEWEKYQLLGKGVVAVCKSRMNEETWQCFDTNGREVYSQSFYSITPFEDGKSRVMTKAGLVCDLKPNGDISEIENENTWLLGTWSCEDALGYSSLTFSGDGLKGEVEMFTELPARTGGGRSRVYGSYVKNGSSVIVTLPEGKDTWEANAAHDQLKSTIGSTVLYKSKKEKKKYTANIRNHENVDYYNMNKKYAMLIKEIIRNNWDLDESFLKQRFSNEYSNHLYNMLIHNKGKENGVEFINAFRPFINDAPEKVELIDLDVEGYQYEDYRTVFYVLLGEDKMYYKCKAYMDLPPNGNYSFSSAIKCFPYSEDSLKR
jgi:hypothetical protein